MSEAALPNARTPAKPTTPKAAIEAVTESAWFKFFIVGCIVVNSLLLGLDAHLGPDNAFNAQFTLWDDIFLYIFTIELLLEFWAQGWRRWVGSGWNWFDAVIVGASWLSAVPGVTALRAFRVVRVFRLVSAAPQMQRVVEALVRAMPGVVATLSILAIVFYIGAIMATTLFGQAFPERFGDLQKSAMVLFQLALFDDWGAIVNEVGAVFNWAPVFFLTFTVLSAFAVLNLFIGVIVDAVQDARDAEVSRDVKEMEDEVEELAEAQEDAVKVQQKILDEIRLIRDELSALRRPPNG
jgi:voltage-gated sodium channel